MRTHLLYCKCLILLLLNVGVVNPVWAIGCHPYANTQINEILINDIKPTQHGLRKSEETLGELETWMRDRGGKFHFPISLVMFEDGQVYVRNGHHRLSLAKRLGRTTLFRDVDFTLEFYTYDEFLEINLSNNWMTPFDPRTHLRLANFAGFKTLIHVMRSRGIALDKIHAFIRAHPEAYAVKKSEIPQMGEPIRTFEGSQRDREAYFQKMDVSMPLKVGQLLSVLPSKGVIYEPGMGSGMQAAAHAALYPNLLVAASDLDLGAVRRAQALYPFDNIVFFMANALDDVFPGNFLDGMSDGSTTHHLVSYGDPPFVESRVTKYRRVAHAALRSHANYGMRDYTVAQWPDRVRITLPTTLRAGDPPFENLSLADLFLDFNNKFRSHDYPRGADVKEIPGSPEGFRCFEGPGEFIQNFMLRINYVKDDSWPAEMKEQYTYFNQREHIESAEQAGFRVDYAAEVHNPWMRRNWWLKNNVHITDDSGRPIEWPPTNFLLYATKLEPGMPKRLTVQIDKVTKYPKWLKVKSYARRGDETEVVDLVEVPGVTHFYVPFEVQGSQVYVYLFRDVERPGYVYYHSLGGLATEYYGGYHPEGMAHVVPEHVDVGTAFSAVLGRKAGEKTPNNPQAPLAFNNRPVFFPSPGGSNEIVFPYFVDVKSVDWKIRNPHKVRRVELNQLIASAHVGAIPDPRLEVMAYQLGRQWLAHIFTWMGETILRDDQVIPPQLIQNQAPNHSSERGKDKFYWKHKVSADFMQVRSVRFEREVERGRPSEIDLEFAMPKSYSSNTVTVIPYAQSLGKIYVGLEARDLVALETRSLNSQTHVVPAWRLPKAEATNSDVRDFMKNALQNDFGLTPKQWATLGEGYFPSPAHSSEHVYPLAIEVDMSNPPRDLTFYPLTVLLKHVDGFPDLHTRLSIYRLAHALGLLK